MSTWKQDGPKLPFYREGDDLDWYLKNTVIYACIMENIKSDLGGDATDAECMEELKRLCEPSVRHYNDCLCALCR